MAEEAPLEQTDTGTVPKEDGWFVLNARDARWRHREGRGAYSDVEGDLTFEQIGMHLCALGPGEPMAMYHWEIDQEDFLVVAGEALLVVEGEERALRQWDFVHCPPGTKHVIIGAGEAGCLVVAVGGRERGTGDDWGGYTVDETAAKHGVSVERETTKPEEAYSHLERRQPTRYRDGWLPN
jgi:uncharacterized cupin superfamily protein